MTIENLTEGEWKNSYPQSQQPFVEQFAKHIENMLTNEFFEHLFQLAMIEPINAESSQTSVAARQPLAYLKKQLLVADPDTATQLKAILLETYLKKCGTPVANQERVDTSIFSIENMEELSECFADVLNYLDQKIAYIHDAKNRTEIGTEFQNVEKMFFMIDDAIFNGLFFDLGVAGSNMDYEKVWNNFVSKKIAAFRKSHKNKN